IWIPVNVLMINALLNYYAFYGNKFKIECPTGSGNKMNLLDVAKFISARISDIFIKNENGTRPSNGNSEKLNQDAYWNKLILFYEYFHGDTGQGLGASHQTGWTGCVVELLKIVNNITPENFGSVTHFSWYNA
ncbi:MAG: MGH1-like glycoside hydrolase domain-containing protein, partial [Desulfobulbia bacterium]